MIDRQHVWVGPEATSFEASCEVCEASYRRGDDDPPRPFSGTIRREADVRFSTCPKGHRLVVHRVPLPVPQRPSERRRARRALAS